MIKKSPGIYLITCSPPNRLPLYYVGQSVNLHNRQREHFSELKRDDHNNPYMQSLWKMYGAESFKFEVLEVCERDDLDDREQWWLDHMHGYRRCLNLAKDAASPNRGKPIPPDVRAKIGAAQRGKIISYEQRKAISASLKGRKQSAEFSAKLSAAFKGRVLTAEHRSKLSVKNGKLLRQHILMMAHASRFKASMQPTKLASQEAMFLWRVAASSRSTKATAGNFQRLAN